MIGLVDESESVGGHSCEQGDSPSAVAVGSAASGEAASCASGRVSGGGDTDVSYNVFNRLFYSLPADSGPNGLAGLAAVNPQTPPAHGNTYLTSNPATSRAGLLSAGFGFVNWVNGGSAQPRTGQLVARFTF